MGWNTIRRTTLVFFLTVGTGWSLFCATANLENNPLPARQSIGRTDVPNTNATSVHQIPRQNHSPATAWSINIKSRPQAWAAVMFWVERWSSPGGIKAINEILSREFEFRMVVDRTIRNANLPWELRNVPFVESRWLPDAVSSSGASGPWQFLSSSARGRDLVIDTWRDERRDIWLSTEAAMKELSFSYSLFQDWILAIASYNAGPTTIRKLKESSNLQSFWEMLDAGIIPPETQSYVPKVLATAYISAHAGRFGLNLSWKTPLQWERIQITRSIFFSKLIEEIDANPTLMQFAHSELLHPVTPPQKDYFIKVPQSLVGATQKWLQESTERPERFWRYTVQPKDTLSVIARRFGVNLSDLLVYNSYTGNNPMLRVGKRIYIPGSGEPPLGVEKDSLPVWNGRYRVKAGDSLWSIARRYGLSPEQLAEANSRPLEGTLTAGSALMVPLLPKPSKATAQ